MNKFEKNFLCPWKTVVAMVCMIFLLGGCATTRQVRVVDESGLPVSDALVLFWEVHLSPFFNNIYRAGFSNSAGEYTFESCNGGFLLAFDSSSKWGRGFVGNAPRTVVVATMPYDGGWAERYLANTSHVDEKVRQRLEVFLVQKIKQEADYSGELENRPADVNKR